MTTITQKLADALRAVIDTAPGGVRANGADNIAAKRDGILALAAYDAQQAQAPLWTVFIRDEDNTGTTYITCVAATDLDAAKGLASAQCRDDWGYEEDAPLHILGVIEGYIGAVIEWDDCE